MKKIQIVTTVLIFLISGIIHPAISGNVYQDWKKIVKDKTDKIKIDTDKIKDNTNDVFENDIYRLYDKSEEYINDKFKEQWKETLTNFSEGYDVTDFNYAISFGDNSTPHEAKGNLKQAKGFAIYLADPANTNEIPPKIKGQNFNYTGEILYVSSSYKMSEKSLLKADKIYNENKLSDSTFASLTLSNLGLLYHTTGRYALAEEYTKKALEKREKGADKTGYAASLNNIAVLYKDMGLYTKAEEYIIKAQDYLKKTGEDKSIKYAIVLNNRAMIYQMTGKYKDAEKLMKESIKLAGEEVKEKSPTYVRLEVNLALLYQLTKRYEEAEKIYLDAIKIKKRRMGKSHPDYAVLLRNTASLYQQMRRFDKVEPLLKEAVGIYEKQFGKEHPSYAQAIYELGLFYQSQDKLSKAEPLLNEALGIQKKTLGEHHPNITLTYENLAVLYWQKEDYKKAADTYKKTLNEYIYQINTFFPAMNEYEKSKFWEKIQTKFVRFYNFAVKAQNDVPEITGDVYNFHIATKALLLSSSRKVKARILNSGNKALIAKYNNWQDTKSWLAKLYTYSNEELKEENINIDSLETVVLNLEKDITKSSEEFKKANELKTITYNDIAKVLKPNEAAVEIIRINSFSYLYPRDQIHYLALVLKNNNEVPKMVFMKDGDNMESAWSEEYQETIHSGKSMKPFYDYYWKSIAGLTSTNDKKLYISVDGIYNQVNINTIQLPSERHILDVKDVRFVTNTKDILSFNKAKKFSKTAFLLGYPDYKLDLPDAYAVLTPLPGTKKEVNTIQSLLKSNYYKVNTVMEKNATEENLKKVKSPYILHIATHGYFLENEVDPSEDTRSFGIEPMKAYENPLLRSGLLLAGADRTVNEMNTKDNKDSDDGILNAFEAMILDLDNTDIVILSACQTGLGEIKNGEGVYGLQRSFQIAGASSVITSLWEVSDEGTQDLMSSFYKHWLKSGDKHDAFHKAQLEIKEKYKYPFYWGAFVLVGE
ncbi:MAG: CHAT domain-containing protein [Bacteroidales bacterium]|nr:CHAT domain-containing protein [Bacteroidales bacterium]